jgi:hypothetical protein
VSPYWTSSWGPSDEAAGTGTAPPGSSQAGRCGWVARTLGQAAACEVQDRRVAAAAVRARVRKLPSSKNPVRDRARVMTAWAAPSPSSFRALVLRLLVVSQA